MKYKIDLVQTIYEGATVFVDADSQEEAEDKVYAMLEEVNNPDGSGPQIEWKFTDCQNDAEITCVEEMPEGKLIDLMSAVRATMED
jgi:hypothetical protein